MANDNSKSQTEKLERERKKQTWSRYIVLGIAALALVLYLFEIWGTEDLTGTMGENMANSPPAFVTEQNIDENGSYTSKDAVALYIHTFDKLPQNFITKDEAKELGWVASEGNLAKVAPGKSIGGDRFGNYEELLPDADGRRWTECDINYKSGTRGAERIIFSNDGLIYYTDDHYESFTQLYGEEADAA